MTQRQKTMYHLSNRLTDLVFGFVFICFTFTFSVLNSKDSLSWFVILFVFQLADIDVLPPQRCCLLALVVFIKLEQPVSAKCYTSISGIALTGHAISSFPVSDIHQCYLRCKAELVCQSLTYFILTNTCQLNNRTIAVRPESSKHDVNAVYFENPIRGKSTENRYQLV